MTTAAPSAATSAHVYPSARYSWYVLGVICFGYVFAFIDRTILGLLAPAIQKDLGITDTQMGLLQGLGFAIFYTIFGLPLGWISDRYNRKWILSGGMFFWTIMTALCGLATGFKSLFAARAGVGIGEATLNPCASSLISDYFPPEKRPRAFGFYTMSTAVANILSYVIGGTLLGAAALSFYASTPFLADFKPWQIVFLIIALPGLIPVALLAFTVKEPVRLGQALKKGQATTAETWAFVMKNKKSLGLFLVACALVILEIYGAAYWHATIFIRVYGWTPAETAFKFGVMSGLIGIVSAYMSGSVTSYFRKKGMAEGVWMTALLGAIGCTIFGGFGPMMPTWQLALPILLLKALFVNYSAAAAMTAINEITPNEHRGLVTSMYVILTGLVAQGIGPLAVGMGSDMIFKDPMKIGWSLALVVFVTGILAIICLLWGRNAYREALARVTWEAPAKK
jgi:MFS family permease